MPGVYVALHYIFTCHITFSVMLLVSLGRCISFCIQLIHMCSTVFLSPPTLFQFNLTMFLLVK